MARWLRQSTQVCAAVGPFIKVSDSVTSMIGLSVASGGCRVKKNNANWVPAKSDVFENEDGGGPFYEMCLSAGDVDTLGLLRWTVYPSAASGIFQVWEDFMVVDPVTYDAHFGTGPMRSDVVTWAHTTVTAMPGDYTAQQKANVVAWTGVTVQAITTANLNIPADVVVWEHVTANALNSGLVQVDVERWVNSVATAMPGSYSAIQKANVAAWTDVTVQAITTANLNIPADVIVWEHATANALNTGLVQVDVERWANSIVTAMPGSLAPRKADVISWSGVTVQAITTANLNIPADVIVWEHATANALNTGLVQVDVERWANSAVSAMPGNYTAIYSSNVVAWTGVTIPAITTALPYVRSNTLAWNDSLVSGMPGPPGASATNRVNVIAWQDVTVQAITTANLAIPADVIVWAHSTVSAMPGPAAGATGNVNVVAWSGVTVQAITTANNAIPSDVIVWAHSSVSAMPGAPGGAIGNVNVIAWSGVTVQAITTANNAIPADIIVWQHATVNSLNAGLVQSDAERWANSVVSAMPGSYLAQQNANVMAWSTVTIPAITTVTPYPMVDRVVASHVTALPITTSAAPWMPADVRAWNASPVSAMPGAPSGATGNVNVIAWSGVTVQAITTANNAIPSDVIVWQHTTVAAIVTAGWPQVEVASYTAGHAPPTSVSIGAGGITSTSFAADAINANALAADAVDEILDDALESTLTVRQALRIMLAACAGKLSGANTTNVLIRDFLDTKNRIDATVDVNGDRTSVTLDGT